MILFLIRHANTDATGKAISGREPGILLNDQGRRQAEQLAPALVGWRIESIVSSPLERARQTAEALAGRLGLTVQIAEGLTDIDFGDWTGQLLSKLEPIELWKQWNLFRSTVRIPNGETILEVQGRMMHEVERLTRSFPRGRIVLVSHADPIRTVLAHFLGMPLDMLHRLEINPASVSTVCVNPWGAQVQQTNLTFYPSPALA